MTRSCILALDLGTSSFKAAPVDTQTVFGVPTVVPYALDHKSGSVTCPPARYIFTAFKALRGAIRTARELGLTIRGIGISSQAQTFLAQDRGVTVLPAVVWTDAQATAEAAEAEKALLDYAQTSGFLHPSPLQFLPKVMRFQRQGKQADRFLLLNEWLIHCLTGKAIGDETNQGMGGFYDISRRAWSEAAMGLANITSSSLAKIGPAATLRASLHPEAAHALNLPVLPVVSCGNDQSCAAIGSGLKAPGDIFCNFGTAMVVYMLKDHPVAPASEDQIAGISPLAGPIGNTTENRAASGQWFLLGLESECGNVLDWLSERLAPDQGVGSLIEMALRDEVTPEKLPLIHIVGGKLDLSPLPEGIRTRHLARALMEYYADRFGELLSGISKPDERPSRLFVGGGLSRSDAWLDFLSRRYKLTFERTACEHPGLLGIAQIIQTQEARWNTVSNT